MADSSRWLANSSSASNSAVGCNGSACSLAGGCSSAWTIFSGCMFFVSSVSPARIETSLPMSGAQARNAIITKLIDLVKYRHLWGSGVSRRLASLC